MPKRNTPRDGETPSGRTGPTTDQLRVLVVEPDESARRTIRNAVAALPVRCETTGSLAQGRRRVGSGAYDLVLVDADADAEAAMDLVRALAERDEPVGSIVVTASAAIETAVEAMRCGAIDLILKPLDAHTLRDRINHGIDHVRRQRDKERRVQRLRRICKRLNNAREEVTRQVDVLCTDLIGAYQDLADQMNNVSLASEFSSLVRAELDVEDLLRTTLEFLLGKTGPTNAAVFLPTGACDYSLGAYVNYDIPKDSSDVLLDHLADVLAPPYAEEEHLVHVTSEPELVEALGDDAHWMSGSDMVVFSCRRDDECLAVIALFRARSAPFTEETVAQLEVIRELFTDQLARVVRIHHRHMGEDGWPGFDVQSDDDIDGMAA